MKKLNKTKKVYDLKMKNKCVMLSALSYLAMSIYAFFSAPVLICLLGGLSLVLLIVSFKKKSIEEKEADKILKQMGGDNLEK